MKVLQTCQVWFPKHTLCSPGSLLAFPHPCSYTAGSAEKGQDPTFCRCSSPAWCLLLSHQDGHPQPRAGSWLGSASILLLPHCHLVPQSHAPTAWGNAPSLILYPDAGHTSSLWVIIWEKVTKASYTLKDTCIYFTRVPDGSIVPLVI